MHSMHYVAVGRGRRTLPGATAVVLLKSNRALGACSLNEHRLSLGCHSLRGAPRTRAVGAPGCAGVPGYRCRGTQES